LKKKESLLDIKIKGIRLYWFFFFFFVVVALFLRFAHLEEAIPYTWDQVRDAWMMRDILVDKKLPLVGPRAGIGHFHLGPAYYYLLAIFYFFTNLDPIASAYLAVFAVVVTMVTLFLVAKSIFGVKTGLVAVYIYALCPYLINMDRVSWNVSFLMAISCLIFYFLVKMTQKGFTYFLFACFLAGTFFHIHFTAIFALPVIFLSSLLVVGKKKKFKFWYLLVGPIIFLLPLVPNIVFELKNNFSEAGKLNQFWGYYFHGFHLRFMLFRLKEIFLMLGAVIRLKTFGLLNYLIFFIFTVAFLFCSKTREIRFAGIIIFLWFAMILFGFTLYSGPISDYYYLSTMPFTIYILAWLTVKIGELSFKPLILLLAVFWLFWGYRNFVASQAYYPNSGLRMAREAVAEKINAGERIGFSEGDIKAYLYYLETREDEKK